MNTQSSYGGEFQSRPLTTRVLHQQNLAFQGTGGISSGNRCQGFAPAFLDTETATIHLSRYADGRLAPVHLLDGLPSELVVKQGLSGQSITAKRTLIAGFVREGLFYTREQAARCVRDY
jgi:hypothetical protein